MPVIKDKITGDVVSRQPYTAEGTQRAEQIVKTDPNWEIDYAPGGTQDASARNTTTYSGSGETGYNQIGNPMYKEGGSVYEKNQAKREKIAEANKEMAKSSKKRRDDRRKARDDRRAAKKAAKSKPKVSGKSREEKRNIKKIESLESKGVKVKTTAKTPEDTKQLKPTGKIKKRHVKEVLVTKGGAYPTYDKKSKPAKKFNQKFKEERAKQGPGGTFTWDGRKYTTNTADDKKKVKPKDKPKVVAKDKLKPKPKTKAKGKSDKSLGIKPKKSAISTPKPKKFTKKAKRPKDVSEIVSNIPPAKKTKTKPRRASKEVQSRTNVGDLVKTSEEYRKGNSGSVYERNQAKKEAIAKGVKQRNKILKYKKGGKTKKALGGKISPRPEWDQWGRGGVAGGTRYEKGGKVTEGARKHLEDALKHLEDAEKPKNIDTLIEAMKRRGKYNPPKRKPRIVPPRKKS